MTASSARGVSWRVNAERLALLGWGRAILLQVAHPLIAAGVHEHSSFRATPLAAVTRLHQTVHAMLSLTFGSAARRERTLDEIRAIHRRVNGVLTEPVGAFPAGTRYSAEDPDLVLWVHVTLLDSIPLIYDAVCRPLGASDWDAYCREAAPIAVALGAREAEVPRTRAAVQCSLERMYASGALAVGRHGRELGRAVVEAPVLRGLPVLGRWNRLVTLGLLPAPVREAYGFPWSDADAVRGARVLRRLRALRRVLPEPLAWWQAARREVTIGAPASHERSTLRKWRNWQTR